MELKIAVLAGDGIGPEITKEAIKREFMSIEEYSLQNFYRALYNATEVTKDTSSGDIINEWCRINKTIENTCIHDIIETCIYFLIFLEGMMY